MSPNIVLICLDTVRKDYFDSHAKKLQQLSDLSFSQARSGSSWTIPSHATMLTGETVDEHQVTTYSRDFSKLREKETFLDRLEGYQTTSITSNNHLSDIHGFSDLFDQGFIYYKGMMISTEEPFWEGITGRRKPLELLDFIKTSYDSDESLNALRKGLKAQLHNITSLNPYYESNTGKTEAISRKIRELLSSSKPQFIYANYITVPPPLGQNYRLNPDNRRMKELNQHYRLLSEKRFSEPCFSDDDIELYRKHYAEEIRRLDSAVSQMIEEVRSEESERNTVFIVTSDHGHAMGTAEEDYNIGHYSNRFYDSMARVPLEIIGVDKNEEIDSLTSHTMLGETVIDISRDEDPVHTLERCRSLVTGPVKKEDNSSRDAQRASLCRYSQDEDGIIAEIRTRDFIERYRTDGGKAKKISTEYPENVPEMIEEVESIPDRSHINDIEPYLNPH
ncbi:MAG: sulfatase-like hydrolase/transferase [Candidatus Nanohaloarchaea archaeon]